MSEPVYRVWLGWRTDALRQPDGWPKFVEHLRKTFIPATWQVMGRFGLMAYVPSVMVDGQARDIPDETALLVYRCEARYASAFDTVAGGAYGLLHKAVFTDAGTPHPHSSRSAWAAFHPAVTEGKVAATVWPSPAGGPTFAQRASRIVFLALAHPTDALPDVQAVHGALGQVDGELVVCREHRLSFVWMATRGERDAAAVAGTVAAAQPSWTLHAAHDAVPSTCDPDGFEVPAADLVLDADRTLHFASL